MITLLHSSKIALLIGLLAAPRLLAAEAAPSNPYRQWSHGPPTDSNFFPIAVWLQPPGKAKQYLAAGINTYVGLWQGPTEEQLATLRRAGMKLICDQNEVARKHLDDSTINGRSSFAFGGGNDTFNGGDGNDVLMGGPGSDALTGGFGLGAAGANEIDRLAGDDSADVFVLGDADKRFYDDESPSTPGIGAYASIEDFTPSQGDRLRLFGSAAQYLLGISPIAGTPGTALYHDSNGNAVLDPATDELISILASPVTLTPANTLGTATFIQILDPALIGLDAITPAVADDGTGQRFKVQFSIIEPMTAGMLLEIQASTDLGATDPWTTVASKTGGASWVGPANVTVSAPSGGKVTVAVSALQPVSIVGRQFYRFRLSSL